MESVSSVSEKSDGSESCSGSSRNSYEYDEDDDIFKSECPGIDKLLKAINTEIDEVNSLFGQYSAIYCEPDVSERLHCGHGSIYLNFRVIGGSLGKIRHLGMAWGFDENEAIVIRFGAVSHLFREKNSTWITRENLAVTAYQGNEPPFPWKAQSIRKIPAPSSEEANVAGEIQHVPEKKDGGILNAKILSRKKMPFRLGWQLQHIVEEFIISNMKGEGRRKGLLTLPIDSSTQGLDEVLKESLRKAQQREGLLARLYSYVFARLPHLHQFCVNCDQTHLSLGAERTEPVVPSVCQRDRCWHAFTELGIGRASTKMLTYMAEVVDLLLAITVAAAKSQRAQKILNPFPFVLHNRQKILDPEKPDYEKALAVAEQLPSMQQIVTSENQSQLINICRGRGEHVYNLLQWVVSSCPARIVSLQRVHHVHSMRTPYQFLIQSASRQREEIFEYRKQKHGSVFAFHGSSIENWHAILRQGIKNCSGTNLQVNGAAYGEGIYLSPMAALSLTYSQVNPNRIHHMPHMKRPRTEHTDGGNTFISDQKVHIMALCEVIDDGTIQKYRNNDVWVVSNDLNVIARFLFIFLPASPGFPDIYAAVSRCNTVDISFSDEIRSKMKQAQCSASY